MLLTALKDYRYYDSPDGTSPISKLIACTKYGFSGSLCMGLYDVVLLSQTTTFISTLNCMAFWVVPVTSMCAIAPMVTYAATNLRGKDDRRNYFLGALSVGPILNAWLKLPGPATAGILGFLALTAVLQKDCAMTGQSILPDISHIVPRRTMIHDNDDSYIGGWFGN